jgi:hypothetical protein
MAFKDGKVTDAEIKACRLEVHNITHLIIDYPDPKPMDICKVPKEYPYTPEYKAAEFKKLPAVAKGKVDANPCNGVTPINTLPAPGSPKSCKCEKITMNGPFSPGGLVRCTECSAMRRSRDKGSCPIGTKLFSPRGRTDWMSFLKSAQPLRDPHWIIDVTRPKNGCGGCTRYPMNSKQKEQKSWVTADGTPWWLRSTRYNEPNGDYTANCYLDLWKTPKNEDEVTWNDGRCNYHSKSYYCQAVKVTQKPKPGSPSGCVCKEVAIADGERYSPGVLMKCTNCLTVRKATDRNSCPFGTKVFAPATRADWKAFIASDKPLRAPHWIVDVTRPQNGCGGCTKFPMNSGVASQSTWKTADGGAWWLRKKKYNEPNGDYNANCYLDLWQTPVNENSVTFNDGRCHYHSKSYYCQKAVPKKTTTTTKAPPPPKLLDASMDITLGRGGKVVSYSKQKLVPDGKTKDTAFRLYVASGDCVKNADDKACTGPKHLKAWSKKGPIKSGNLVVWYNKKNNKVLDCSTQKPHGCSLQPFPLPNKHVGSPRYVFKIIVKKGRRFFAPPGTKIKVGDPLMFMRPSNYPNKFRTVKCDPHCGGPSGPYKGERKKELTVKAFKG